MMEKLTTEEANTFLALWSDVQDRAVRRLRMAVTAEFGKRYHISTLQKSFNLEKDIDATVTTAAAAQYRGIYIDDNYLQTGEEIKRSALQNHYVQVLYYYSPIVQANAVIKIFDYDLNTTLDTFTQNFVIGWNTIQVNTSYPAYKLFIGVDSTTFNSVTKNLPSNTQNYPVNVRGGSFTIGSDISTLTLGENTFGLSGIFSVKCKYDNIVCNNLELFSLPYANLCCSEFMLEVTASTRWNHITTSQKQAHELKDHYDIESEKSIEQACSGIDLDLSDICLDCGERLQVKEAPFFSNNYSNDC